MNAGFSSTTPWMRVNEDYKTWNAEAQCEDLQSVHAFYKKALQLRKKLDVLVRLLYVTSCLC